MWNLKGCGGSNPELVQIAIQTILTFTCSDSEKLPEISAVSVLGLSKNSAVPLDHNI
jgi:hypothetical protein